MVASVAVAGCGGSPGRGSAGTVLVRIRWADVARAAAVDAATVPDAARCVRVHLANAAGWNAAEVAVRPSTAATASSVAVSDVPPGQVHAHFGAYEGYEVTPEGQVVASGDLLAWATTEIAVVAGTETRVGFTLSTSPHRVEVRAEGDPGNITVGDELQLTATACDAEDNVVAVGGFAWSSSNDAVATVDASGLVTGRGPGEADVSAGAGGIGGRLRVRVSEGAPPAWELWDSAPGAGSYNTIVYGGKLYCFGPNTLEGPTSTWYVYTPATRSWLRAPDLPGRRHTPALGVIDDSIYLAECFDYTNNQNWEIDPATLAVRQRAAMPVGSMPPPTPSSAGSCG